MGGAVGASLVNGAERLLFSGRSQGELQVRGGGYSAEHRRGQDRLVGMKKIHQSGALEAQLVESVGCRV